jgi:hypothetical protein
MTSQPTNDPTNPEPGQKRQQTPEETLARMAGIPKTLEEQQADAQQLHEERMATAQRNAGVQPNQANQPNQTPVQHHEHDEQERERQAEQKRQREKA